MRETHLYKIYGLSTALAQAASERHNPLLFGMDWNLYKAPTMHPQNFEQDIAHAKAHLRRTKENRDLIYII